VRVATHPALRGYVFKVFFVEEQGREREKPCGWKNFTAQCNQAERILRDLVSRDDNGSAWCHSAAKGHLYGLFTVLKLGGA
jgi:hypothetical protein